MNIVLLFEEDRAAGERFRITGRRARHVASVLRAAPGDEIRVGLLEGPLGTARVVCATTELVEMDCRFDGAPPPRPLLDLVLAIPRPRSLSKLLPEIAALGVDRLVLLRTWRVAKPYLTAKMLLPSTYRPLLHEGLMQARSTREPTVALEPLFRPFVEDRLPAIASGARALVAHPAAETDIASLRLRCGERVLLAVGPEGGFIPWEIEALERAGLTPISLGPRTLRVETAAVAAIANVELIRRRGQ